VLLLLFFFHRKFPCPVRNLIPERLTACRIDSPNRISDLANLLYYLENRRKKKEKKEKKEKKKKKKKYIPTLSCPTALLMFQLFPNEPGKKWSLFWCFYNPAFELLDKLLFPRRKSTGRD
jgi:hypothetical protein